jgi:hypothetical protein
MIIISSERPIRCCTFHIKVGIFIDSYRLDYSSVHKYLSRESDHVHNLHLQRDRLIAISDKEEIFPFC